MINNYSGLLKPYNAIYHGSDMKNTDKKPLPHLESSRKYTIAQAYLYIGMLKGFFKIFYWSWSKNKLLSWASPAL